MNKLLTIAFALFLIACGSPSTETTTQTKSETSVTEDGPRKYGDEIHADRLQVMSGDDVLAKLNETEEVQVAMKGVINETCIKKGCWMTMNVGTDEEMRVTFKDYGFFVPTEGQGGKTAVIQGVAKKTVTDVDMLKHYAEDAGRSEAEIAAITEPEIALGFEATGVIIYD